MGNPDCFFTLGAGHARRHGHHGHALVGGKAAGDKIHERLCGWIVVRRDFAGELVAQRCNAGGLRAGMNIIRGEFADGLLLLDVGEPNFLPGDGIIELVIRNLLATGTLEESFVGVGSLLHVVSQQAHVAPCAACNFQMVPGLVGHVECDSLAGE